MRQAPVAKGDFHISWRPTHADFNLTKSDVKVNTNTCNGSPARSVQISHPLSVFTPNSGLAHQLQKLSGIQYEDEIRRTPSMHRQTRPIFRLLKQARTEHTMESL